MFGAPTDRTKAVAGSSRDRLTVRAFAGRPRPLAIRRRSVRNSLCLRGPSVASPARCASDRFVARSLRVCCFAEIGRVPVADVAEVVALVAVAVRRAVLELSARRRVRRDVRPYGPGAPALSGAVRGPARRLARRSPAAPDRGRQGVPDTGHHVHGLRRRPGHRAHLPLRHPPAHRHGRGVADARARAHAAADGHQPVPQGRLPRGPDPRRRRRAAGAGPELQALPARNAGRARPPRHLRLGCRAPT